MHNTQSRAGLRLSFRSRKWIFHTKLPLRWCGAVHRHNTVKGQNKQMGKEEVETAGSSTSCQQSGYSFKPVNQSRACCYMVPILHVMEICDQIRMTETKQRGLLPCGSKAAAAAARKGQVNTFPCCHLYTAERGDTSARKKKKKAE